MNLRVRTTWVVIYQLINTLMLGENKIGMNFNITNYINSTVWFTTH